MVVQEELSARGEGDEAQSGPGVGERVSEGGERPSGRARVRAQTQERDLCTKPVICL